MKKVKDKIVKAIKGVISILRLATRVLVGILHAFSEKCGSPKCTCENEVTDNKEE